MLPVAVCGQSAPEVPASKLRGKQVGVFVSLKNLSFQDHYYKMMAAWLQRQDSLNLQYEDIRVGIAVKLGNYLTQVLQQQLGADTVFNMNADAAIGQAFLNSYRGGQLNTALLQKALPEGTDYIVVIDLLDMQSRKVNALYAFSNDVVAEKRVVLQGNLRVLVFSAAVAAPVAVSDIRFDEDISPNQRAYYATPKNGAPAQRAFDIMLNPVWVDIFDKAW